MIAASLRQQADVSDTQYETRAVAGGPTTDEPYVDHGLSVAALLSGVGVDPTTVGFSETDRSGGAWSTLTAADLTTPTDFAGHLAAVVRVDGDVVEYVRPLRDDPSDVNAPDLIRTPSQGTLTLHVHSGPLLAVQAAATPSTVQVGQVVTLSATSSGAAPTSFRWDLGDGTVAEGPQVAHTYPGAGTWAARVTASGSDDSGGQALVAVTVVAPSPSPTAARAVPIRRPSRAPTPVVRRSASPLPVAGAPSPVVVRVPASAAASPRPTAITTTPPPTSAPSAASGGRPVVLRATAAPRRSGDGGLLLLGGGALGLSFVVATGLAQRRRRRH